MLDCKPSPSARPSLIYLQRTPRWQSGSAPHSYRRDLGIAPSQYLRRRTGLSGADAGSRGLAMLLLAMLTGCATQGRYQATPLEAPEAWTMPAAEASLATPSDDAWWHQLNDPAIDVLVDAALVDSPSIAQAIAKVDEARALLGATSAQRMPSVDVNGYATRARSLETDSPTGTILSTQSGIGPELSWEIDLFGRVRNSVEAGALRIQARDADAKAARLALTSQIGDLVLALRACELSIAVLHEEINSRENTLGLTRRRLETGFVAPIEEARAQSGLATARTTLATRQEACARNVNALVAITGRRDMVAGVFAQHPDAARTGSDRRHSGG
ncbi:MULTISPECIES: TolC family protein [unclassified Pseudomonas]|uniref:TolC family protein n=1 Tax=unclassified Pseudomonas TaxID=196821 RepID=UPI00235FF760|nr:MULTISPECIES: TolC family protein [unclassified Pseudomonas]